MAREARPISKMTFQTRCAELGFVNWRKGSVSPLSALEVLYDFVDSIKGFEQISADPMRVAMRVISWFHDYLRCLCGRRDAVMRELATIGISVARELRT